MQESILTVLLIQLNDFKYSAAFIKALTLLHGGFFKTIAARKKDIIFNGRLQVNLYKQVFHKYFFIDIFS